MSDSLQPHGLQHTMLLCPLLFPGVCSNPCPLSQWCHITVWSSAVLFPLYLLLLPSIFTNIGVFWMSQLFSLGGQSIGASESVLPMNIQSQLPLGLTGLISLQSKGLSRVFSSTTLWKHRFFCIQPLHGPTLTSVHDYWKNHGFDYMDLCWQSDVSAFEFTV